MGITKQVHEAVPLAYQIVLEDILSQEMGDELGRFQRARKKPVVVSGWYPDVEHIFSVLEIRHTSYTQKDLNGDGASLDGAPAVFLNCSGEDLTPRAFSKIEKYVLEGGRLITTGKAIDSVLQEIFPGTLRRNSIPQEKNIATSGHVVRVLPFGEIGKTLLGSVAEEVSPQWTLAKRSYPITIMNYEQACPLITSDETSRRYGSPYIAVGFFRKRGAVVHFISPLTAQQTSSSDHYNPSVAAHFVQKIEEKLAVSVPSYLDFRYVESLYSLSHAVLGAMGISPTSLKKFCSIPSYRIEVDIGGYSTVGSVTSPGVTLNGAFRVGDITTPAPSAQFDLTGPPITIGRDADNNIYLNDSTVSGKHAEIFYNPQSRKVFVRDLQSKNGTHIIDNGLIPINEPRELPSGSTLRIGTGHITFKRW